MIRIPAILLVCFLQIFVYAQENAIKFTRYTAADGLSQNYVVCAFQDSRGFMWFGTQDGLNRFDGYNFKVFKHIPGDAASLSENWIWRIFEDSEGFLWCGTFGGGACRFDRNTETFTTFRNDPADKKSLSQNTIWDFCEYPTGVLWVGANNGLNRFDPANETFTFFKSPPGNANILRIIPDKKGTLWMLTVNGLLAFDIVHETFRRFDHQPGDPKSLGKINGSMTMDASGILWIGSTNDGLNRFDPKTGQVKKFYHDPAEPNRSLPHNFVRDVHADAFGDIWATTNAGLSLLKFSGDSLASATNFQHDPANPQSLSSNYLSNIYESRNGEIWISARNALHRFDRNNQKFKHYRTFSDDPYSPGHDGVLPIFASRTQPGIVWIGTRNGLNKLDERTGNFTHFRRNPRNPKGSLSSNYILSLYEDQQGDLWVGTRGGGLCKMTFSARGEPEYTYFRHDPANPQSLGADNVHYIYKDHAGTLWIGTGGGGLNRFNRENENFTRYSGIDNDPNSLNDQWAYNMLEDHLGMFWVGTAAGGLNLFDREAGTFAHFVNDPANAHSLSNNRVLGIFEARNGDLWIATALGLNKLIRPADGSDYFSFIQYHEADGLPNEVIYGVLEDAAGDLWVSTGKGLCKIHFENGRIRVRTYSAADGLQGDEFDHNSYHRAADGKMYFGGLNGFNAFYPDSVRDNPYVPPIVITDFKILNESVPIRAVGAKSLSPVAGQTARRRNGKSGANNHSPLRKSITETDEMVLSYKDDVISFEFAALNYTVPEKNRYAYKMEGFDEDWIYCGSRRFATYTNLDPGNYIFRVKGSNNDNIWNEKGAAIKLTITPPPWQAWWAYLLYILVGFAAIGGFVSYKTREHAREIEAQAAIESAKIEERERVRKKSSADFHDEAGHLITKITLFLELARRNSGKNKRLQEYLGKIEEHTKTLASGMRDFIWGLDPEKDSLYETMVRLKDFGNAMFQHSAIRFTSNAAKPTFKQRNLDIDDRRAIVFIFKEAMNNCLKHSNATKVRLISELQNDELRIILADNGVGIPRNRRHDGYGLKNMQSRAQKIGASLKIVSTPEAGTQIILKKALPQMGDHHRN